MIENPPSIFIHTQQVCLPGSQITLGILIRLFTLMEDECHKLDLEMAESGSAVPSSSDSSTYTNFIAVVQRERALVDKKSNLEDQIKFLEQTLSFLLLTSSSSSLPANAVEKIIGNKKEQILVIVSKEAKCTHIHNHIFHIYTRKER